MTIISIVLAFCAGVLAAAVAAIFISRARENAAAERSRGESAGRLCGMEEKQAALLSQVRDLQGRLAASEIQLEQEREKSREFGGRAAALESAADRALGLEKELSQTRFDAAQKQSEIARLEAILDKERKQTDEKLMLLSQAKEQMKAEFQNLAAVILDEKSAKFTEQNRANIDALMTPVREQLADFKKRVEDVYDRESKDRVSLRAEISNLKDLNRKISEDAVNLTNALKGDNKAQGNWGELALERVLEMSGLAKGREYETQVQAHDTAGGVLRPDVVVHLPENRNVVIDSKVSLVDWARFNAAADETARAVSLKDHIASIRRHIAELSQKSYDRLVEVRSLDFVLLFINIEAAFLAAIREDGDLFREAFEKNIILVCPSTLLVTLRTIATVWRYENQNVNAQAIAKRAADLYDKFVSFVDTLQNVKSALDRASTECDNAFRHLSTGKGNLVKRIEDFKSLGVKGKKDLPQRLLEGPDDAQDGSPG
jgi:DNA recombination protein RmuC